MKVVHPLLAIAIALATFGTFPIRSHAASFSSGTIVVAQAGDGDTLTGSAHGGTVVPIRLIEFNTAGSQLQSLPLPTVDAGGQYAITTNRDRANGQLNLSADGRYLVIGGTAVAPRTTVAGPIPRSVARIGANGSVDTSTRIVGSYDDITDSGIRGVASLDGSGFWLAGKGINGSDKRGIQYVELGSSSPTFLTDQLENSRHLSIFNGQLYSTNDQVDAVGVGLPVTGPIVPTVAIPNASGRGTWNSAQLFDLNAGVPGVDTAYVTYPSNESSSHIEKWASNGATWTLSESFTLSLPAEVAPATGVLFITARQLGDDVELYATTRINANNSTGNSLVRVLDTAAGYSVAHLATAPANYQFKGVAFAPVAVPEPATVGLFLAAATVLFGATRRRSLNI